MTITQQFEQIRYREGRVESNTEKSLYHTAKLHLPYHRHENDQSEQLTVWNKFDINLLIIQFTAASGVRIYYQQLYPCVHKSFFVGYSGIYRVLTGQGRGLIGMVKSFGTERRFFWRCVKPAGYIHALFRKYRL